jgi:hypothetical protein
MTWSALLSALATQGPTAETRAGLPRQVRTCRMSALRHKETFRSGRRVDISNARLASAPAPLTSPY